MLKRGAKKLVQDLRPWHLGDFEGQSSATVAPLMDQYVKTPNKVLPNGESFSTFKKRYLDFFRIQLDNIKTGEQLMLVTHYRDFKLTEAWLAANGNKETTSDDIDEKTFMAFDPDAAPTSLVMITLDGDNIVWTPLPDGPEMCKQSLEETAQLQQIEINNKKIQLLDALIQQSTDA